MKWSTKGPMESSFDRALSMARESKPATLGIALCAIMTASVWIAPARADDVPDRTVRFHTLPSPLASALIDSSQSGILPLASGAGVAPRTPSPNSARPDPGVNVLTPEIAEVTMTAPRPPTYQELAGNSLRQFIVHHATVHYVYVNGPPGNLAHWRGGKQSICPRTVGLDPASDSFVTARIRAVAAFVGAPVQSDPQCKDNVRILFTADPEAAMNDVVEWASVYFRAGGRYARRRRLIAFKGDHPIQGWYLTTPRGSAVLNTDIGLLKIYLEPIWPQITPGYFRDDHEMSGIGTVILVVDSTKVGSYSLGTIADYAAMLTLSVIQSPDHCDLLPSILDVMSPNCANRDKPTAMTAGDLAFLKALYYRNYVYGPSPARADIEYIMMQQFSGHPL